MRRRGSSPGPSEEIVPYELRGSLREWRDQGVLGGIDGVRRRERRLLGVVLFGRWGCARAYLVLEEMRAVVEAVNPM